MLLISGLSALGELEGRTLNHSSDLTMIYMSVTATLPRTVGVSSTSETPSMTLYVANFQMKIDQQIKAVAGFPFGGPTNQCSSASLP
jgi:hypothetical protein